MIHYIIDCYAVGLLLLCYIFAWFPLKPRSLPFGRMILIQTNSMVGLSCLRTISLTSRPSHAASERVTNRGFNWITMQKFLRSEQLDGLPTKPADGQEEDGVMIKTSLTFKELDDKSCHVLADVKYFTRTFH